MLLIGKPSISMGHFPWLCKITRGYINGDHMIIMDFHGFPTKRRHVLQQKWGKPSDEEVSGAKTDTLWLFNIAMENRWPIYRWFTY